MTGRQKKGIGFGVSGLASIAAAVVLLFTQADVGVLNPILAIVGTLAGALGFTIVLPNTED